MIDRRTQKKVFKNINIKDEISNRYYQKEAITICCEGIREKKEKAFTLLWQQVLEKQEQQFL